MRTRLLAAWVHGWQRRVTAGNLYGMTYAGGAPEQGTIYKLAADGTETVLYTFAQTQGAGSSPFAGLTVDAQGSFYGTTSAGGANADGVVFRFASNGTMKLLHSFAGGSDGDEPGCTLLADGAGQLIGTTIHGGHFGAGTIFRVAE
jgi:uncharacterized repeat protein (TIGR03803 family)